MAATVVEAIGDQVMHALPSHIGEVHRRAGRVFRIHRSTVAPIRQHRSNCSGVAFHPSRRHLRNLWRPGGSPVLTAQLAGLLYARLAAHGGAGHPTAIRLRTYPPSAMIAVSGLSPRQA
jgi:hypothetical protein